MASGDNLVLGQVNVSDETTVLNGPFQIDDLLEVNDRARVNGLFTVNGIVDLNGSTKIGNQDVALALEVQGSVTRLKTALAVKNAGTAIIAAHTSEVSFPAAVDGNSLIFCVPKQSTNINLSAFAADGLIHIAAFTPVPVALPVAWFQIESLT